MRDSKKILKNKSVLLGITGGIAAYKSIELVRRIRDEGAQVTVILTEAAKRFVTPLSLEVASGNPVYTDLFSASMPHLSLTANADLMVIAPATANAIGKFAHGIADDLLSLCFLSYRGTIVIAPTMNWRMYEHPLFQKNLDVLEKLGVIRVGPESGSLACTEEGMGRMAEVPDIVEALKSALSGKDLSKDHVLVTAGPTREYLDPVRFLSNRSSGKMGFAIARTARRRGAQVTLISGPTCLVPPRGIDFIPVETTDEMLRAVDRYIPSATIFVMAAAVSDFKPVRVSDEKIEKTEARALELSRTEDILAHAGALENRPFIVGFAAETGPKIDRARRKLRDKKADMIVFNDVLEPGSGFDSETNKVVLIDGKEERELPLLAKEEVADAIFDRVLELRA